MIPICLPVKGQHRKIFPRLVTGYGNGTRGLDVIVAYGGSLKPGWQGVTIVTPDQLKEDFNDGVINGNGSVLMRDEKANMADPATLIGFLKFVGTHSPGKRILLVFWNHGSAWKGFGYDDNYVDPKTNETDSLSLDEINLSLKNAGYRYDLIGFDACLMANLEVLTTLAPFGDVFVGSEEIEPSFGWDWVNRSAKTGRKPKHKFKRIGHGNCKFVSR